MFTHSIRRHSGKVLTVLVVIIGILLVTLTSISIYFFQKEIERRKDLEVKLEASRASEVRLDAENNALKKDKFLLEEKNKELDEKVNDLTSEVELEQGISKQLKAELVTTKEQLESEEQKNQKLQDQLKRLADLEQENIQFRSQYEEAKNTRDELQKKALELEAQNKDLTTKVAELEGTVQKYVQQSMDVMKNVMTSDAQAVSVPTPAQEVPARSPDAVGLEKIVIGSEPAVVSSATQIQVPSAPAVVVTTPTKRSQGRVLTVDTETNFVIVDMGSKDGLAQGTLLSVYHADKYLGDIRVTQLQEEMAAADLVAPLTSRGVRKDDRVTLK